MDNVDINACKPGREGTHKTFVSTEKYCTHTGKNPAGKYIRQFLVDGGVLPKGKKPKRCDYLLLNDTDRDAYYIELKGSDIPIAIEQIESARTLTEPSLKGYTNHCRIILHRVRSHQIHDDTVIRWKRKNHAVIAERQYVDIL